MDKINVQVVYAAPDRQAILEVAVDTPCTVEHAIEQSSMLQQFPAINLQTQTVGIWGKRVPLDKPCANGDRIEIYRPLIIDPKQARKKRV